MTRASWATFTASGVDSSLLATGCITSSGEGGTSASSSSLA
jgi:hypothetical protein